MATKAKIANNDARKRLSEKYAARRTELTTSLKAGNLSFEEQLAVLGKLQKLPRNSSKTRVRNRCVLSGRPRGYYRKFGLSRIAVRELGLNGEIPGLTKSSW